MDADKILAILDTLPVAELRRVDQRVRELLALYASWQPSETNAAAPVVEGPITYRQTYIRCGKERCKKCSAGAGHGPYWYAYWRQGGKMRSRYLGKERPTGAPEGASAAEGTAEGV